MNLKPNGKTTQSGLDSLQISGFASLKGKRIGVVTNQASVNSSTEHLIDLLRAVSDIQIVRLFAPEQGIFGALQDMEQVHASVDPFTGLNVVSLYGGTPESLYPRAQDLSDIDTLVVDLQDIGTRFYTFAQTVAYCMEIAGKVGRKVTIIDRPNPLNGVDVEGPGVSRSCRSFCGLAPVPVRHGLTMGELAKLMQSGFGSGDEKLDGIKCELEIIPCQNWKRSDYFTLPWVMPTANMPTLETAVVYPGACLFEATNLSEGRGTTRPFELLGAPFIDPHKWIEQTKKEGFELEGVRFRPTSFIPKFQKWAQKTCFGVQLHITDRTVFRPFRTGLALISAAHRLWPEEFAWRGEEYEFVSKVPAIDLLYGSPGFRITVDAGKSLEPLGEQLNAYEQDFLQARSSFLLY